MYLEPSRLLAVLFALAFMVAGCTEPTDFTLPTSEEITRYYESGTVLEAEVRGNVAVVTVQQSAAQIRRGGSLWAKVGPYIYLFTEETFELLQDFPGLGGVRVKTQTAGGSEIASVILPREELTGVLWRRSLNIAGRARLNGTEQITLIEDLIEWGEGHTDFDYNPRYVQRR